MSETSGSGIPPEGSGKSCCAPSREAAGAFKAPVSAAMAAELPPDLRLATPPGGARPLPGPVNAIRVAGGKARVGTDRPELPQDGEGPARQVSLRPYRLEAQTVTNARFAEFVRATGHVTEAERFGWSAVFAGLVPPEKRPPSPLAETPWWLRIDGADWAHPEGPGSDLAGREEHPVTQVSWNDACAFAAWAGGRLPTEAEWEHAAGSGDGRRFTWGAAEPDDETVFCNIWQGRFPVQNSLKDGWLGTAPAISFDPSPAGFYNLLGNVWEWTSDAFRIRSLAKPAAARNDQARRGQEKVLKGGSFLCHVSYCYRYRIAARMGLTPDSATSNVGFRIAFDG